ncbi:bifunctional UDP-N-acetylglucosamine diphosphorylase/glucosamine-1-phosphate N-acetyltransferase GlmU [Iamia sp.]|uniref:bifunctional UDP-N-acetylglucosamine diphosphorylase/glucosamine-1-phosphate N-acetyltransferase GlmU n=1 Tax=Iamia sp. TaxID=2722710 RepID=UPI002CBC7FA4|nr:NTP transferase domain-containing protein [Iamia sp.]HXH55998.1 NTP transferase domain-containing protein [Iamia sp.]
MAERPLSAVVLAAGEGTRMRSERPKPLHLLCGRAMVRYVLDSLAECRTERVVVVVGHGAERVTKKLQAEEPDLLLDFIEQHRQQGTGDAVAVGLTAFPDDDLEPGADDGADILVLPGDTPLLRATTISRLVERHRQSDAACTVLTARLAEPAGYGRVVRGRDGRVARIVEHRDATDEQREIDEINTSIYCFRRSVLAPALRRIQPANDQGEYYLTDVVEVLHDAGYGVTAVAAEDPDETHGVNDRAQLAAAEAELRRRTNQRWLKLGVTMVDPDRTYVDTTVDLATDVTLFPGTILQGQTVIGRGAEVGPDTRLIDCVVGARSTVEQTTARDAEIGADAHVGPYAHVAPGESVADGTITGPFFAAPAPDAADGP